MKKTLFLLIAFALSSISYSQTNQMIFRTDTLNIEVLYPKIGTALADSIINNLLVDVNDGSTQRVVAGFINKFGQQYLVDLLTGNYAGKDRDVILMFAVMNCTDLIYKMELVGRIAHERRINTGYTFDIGDSIKCIGFANKDFKEGLVGTPFMVDKSKGVVILKNNDKVGVIVDYYSVLIVKW